MDKDKRKTCQIEFKVTQHEWSLLRDIIIQNRIQWAWVKKFKNDK